MPGGRSSRPRRPAALLRLPRGAPARSSPRPPGHDGAPSTLRNSARPDLGPGVPVARRADGSGRRGSRARSHGPAARHDPLPRILPRAPIRPLRRPLPTSPAASRRRGARGASGRPSATPVRGPREASARRSAGGQSPRRFLHWGVLTRSFAALPHPPVVHVPSCTNRGFGGGRSLESAWTPWGFGGAGTPVFHVARSASRDVLDPCGRLQSLPPFFHSPIAIANTARAVARRVHTATCTAPTPVDPQLGRPLIKETDPFLLEKRDVIHNRADDHPRPLRPTARTAYGSPRRHDP